MACWKLLVAYFAMFCSLDGNINANSVKDLENVAPENSDLEWSKMVYSGEVSSQLVRAEPQKSSQNLSNIKFAFRVNDTIQNRNTTEIIPFEETLSTARSQKSIEAEVGVIEPLRQSSGKDFQKIQKKSRPKMKDLLELEETTHKVGDRDHTMTDVDLPLTHATYMDHPVSGFQSQLPLLSSPFPSISPPDPHGIYGLGEEDHNGLLNIYIGGLFELSETTAGITYGQSELAAAQLAIRHINQQGTLPGYKLHMFYNDTKVGQKG